MKYPVLLMARELHQGGSERQMAEIALGLDRGRFQPHVGTFRPQGMRGDQLRAEGVPVVQFPVFSFRSLGAVFRSFAIGALYPAQQHPPCAYV